MGTFRVLIAVLVTQVCIHVPKCTELYTPTHATIDLTVWFLKRTSYKCLTLISHDYNQMPIWPACLWATQRRAEKQLLPVTGLPRVRCVIPGHSVALSGLT